MLNEGASMALTVLRLNSQVVTILSTKGKCERASIDEVYLDLTDAAKEMLLESPPELLELIFEEATKSNILGLPSVIFVLHDLIVVSLQFDMNVTNRASYVQDVINREDSVRAWLCRADADYQDKLLSCGAIIVAQLRVKVLEETQFTCSAGIAHNKVYIHSFLSIEVWSLLLCKPLFLLQSSPKMLLCFVDVSKTCQWDAQTCSADSCSIISSSRFSSITAHKEDVMS